MRKPIILDNSTSSNEPENLGSVKMMSIYRLSDAQPDWGENDPSQPDYIANKDLAEKLRPLYVDGRLVLDSSHESGALCLISGDNVRLEVTDNKQVVIHSAGSGGEGPESPCGCTEFVEGKGIVFNDVETQGYKQKQSISLDSEYINKELITPALSGIKSSIVDNTSQINKLDTTVAGLIGEDQGKTIRQIAEEVTPTFDEEAISKIAEQVAKNTANDVATNIATEIATSVAATVAQGTAENVATSVATTVSEEKAKQVAEYTAQNEITQWVQNSNFNNIAAIVDITKPISVYVDERIDEKIVDIGGGASIPVATTETLGGVKIDGETIKMNEKQQLYISKISTDDLVQGDSTLVLNGGNDLDVE